MLINKTKKTLNSHTSKIKRLRQKGILIGKGKKTIIKPWYLKIIELYNQEQLSKHILKN